MENTKNVGMRGLIPFASSFASCNSRAHRNSGYNGHVRDEIVGIINRKGLSGSSLTVDEYEKLTIELVEEIKNSKNPFISGFLSNVKNPVELDRWATAVGSDLPKPVGLSPVKFAGFRKIELPRIARCRKVPVVKYLSLIFVTYLWYADYNNARADGMSPMSAGTIASARAADPGFETAWDFGWGAGNLINTVIYD